MQSVAETWAAFAARVVPKEADEIQIQEMRRAFYAGSYSMLMNVREGISEDTPEEEGVEQLVALQDECEAFFTTIIGTPRERAYTFPNAPAAPSVTSAITPPDIAHTIPDVDGIKSILNDLGGVVGRALPDGWGFVLLLFTYGEGGSLFYISSANREDVIATMKEFIRKQVS